MLTWRSGRQQVPFLFGRLERPPISYSHSGSRRPPFSLLGTRDTRANYSSKNSVNGNESDQPCCPIRMLSRTPKSLDGLALLKLEKCSSPLIGRPRPREGVRLSANCWGSRPPVGGGGSVASISGAEGVIGPSLAGNLQVLRPGCRTVAIPGRDITSLRRNRDPRVSIAPCYVVAWFLPRPPFPPTHPVAPDRTTFAR